MYKWIAIIVAFISMMAAILVVPEVRQFFRFHNDAHNTHTLSKSTNSSNSGVTGQQTKVEPSYSPNNKLPKGGHNIVIQQPGLKESHRFATPKEEDVAARLQGSMTSPSGITMEFQNLETSRPSFFGDRRISRTELAVYRRAGEEMALYSIDLRTVQSIEFLGPEKLKTLYGQTGSYMKVKITHKNGQIETTYCGQYDHLYYFPATEPYKAIKVDFMGIQKIVFGTK